MADFNPDEFLAQTAQPAPSAPSAGEAGAPAFDPDAFLASQPTIDDLTGEEVPEAFAGRSPETAINKSPLSALDRFKMSVGNQKGNIEYLKQRFDAVQPIMDENGQPTSELAVMQNGKWHRIDAKNNWEQKDPWELAKKFAKDAMVPGQGPIGAAIKMAWSGGDDEEFIGDVADAAPVLGGLAAGIIAAPAAGAGALATIGTSAATGAATSTARTSLGRIVGTYDATPEEQLWDISFETLFNAAGAAIPFAVKPTARWVGDKLDDLAQAYKDFAPQAVQDAGGAVANMPKAVFKKLFAGFSVGEDNFDTMLENTAAVKSLMKTTDQAVGGKVAPYHDKITQMQTDQAKDFAQNTRSTLTEIYGKMRSNILNNVDDSFKANLDEPIKASYREAINKGLGKLVVTEEAITRGARGPVDYMTGVRPVVEKVTQKAKTLVGAEAAEYMAKNGLKNARFELLSKGEMQQAIKKGAELGDELGYLASDDDAYSVVAKYYDDMGKFYNGAKRSGKDAAKALLDFKKIASDKAWSLANMEKTRDLPGIKRILDNARSSVDNTILGGLPVDVKNAFTEMNTTYSELQKAFSPVLNANYKYSKTGDMNVYESLLNTFTARPGKKATNKFAIDAAIGYAEDNGLGSLAKKLSNAKRMIQVGEAAKAFNPLQNPSSKNAMAKAGMGVFAAVRAASGDPTLLAAMAGGAAMTSPMMAKTGVALTQGAFKGQQMLANLPKGQAAQFLSNPQAISAYTNAITQAPMIRNQVSDNLNQVMQNQGQAQ